MKKFLSILAAIGMSATAASAVVACGSSQKSEAKDEMTVQSTDDSVWGKDTNSLTKLLESATSGHTKDVADFVKSTLGIKEWRDATTKAPVLGTTYLTQKPSGINDGDEKNFSEISSLPNQIDGATFQKDALKGGTFYLMLHETSKLDQNDKTKKTPVVTLKVTFKAGPKNQAIEDGAKSAANLAKIENLKVSLNAIDQADKDKTTNNHVAKSYQQVGETIIASSEAASTSAKVRNDVATKFLTIKEIKDAVVAGGNIARDGLTIQNGNGEAKPINGDTTDILKANDSITVKGNFISYYHEDGNEALQTVLTPFSFQMSFTA